MRDPVVDTQLDHLGVDHDHLDFVGRSLVEDAHDDRVDTDGFTGSGRARDQEVGHLGDIRDHRVAAYVFTDRKSETALGASEFLCLQNIPQIDDRGVLVGHFDADGGLSGDRSLNSDVDGGQRQLDVVGQIHDPADLDALLRLHLISRDRGALADIRHRHVDAEGPKSLLEPVSGLLELPVRLRVVSCLPLLHQAERRKAVFAVLFAPRLSAEGCTARPF